MTEDSTPGPGHERPATRALPPRPAGTPDPCGAAAPVPDAVPVIRGWSSFASCVLLAAVTILCLAPFSGRAFNTDEPLFVWAAKQISNHPLDPYGFQLNWYTTRLPMSEVTKNPPLASYYGALIGSLAGWSERTLHLAFLLPALGAVLGTYLLARRLCRAPLLAAAAALLTPGLLVSASAVMCDTMMLAFWVLAIALWVEGLEADRSACLIASAFLIAASALTKYFGVSLIPLLFVYSVVRRRRLGAWAWYLVIPLVILAGYQVWTRVLYGRGLLSDAAAYANTSREGLGSRALPTSLDCIAFAGGCVLPALTFTPLLWPRRGILLGVILGGLAGLALGMGWLHPGAVAFAEQRGLVSVQYAVHFGGGVSVLALAGAEFWKRRDAEATLLALWVLGTLLFAGVLNWTVSARSVLPLIPAAGILLARRLEAAPPTSPGRRLIVFGVPLLASGLLSLWITLADADLADSARRAASLVHERTRNESGTVWFQGHWGFQYYMESLGARPADFDSSQATSGDFMVVPDNNTNTLGVLPSIVESRETVELHMRSWLSTMNKERGAGFYSTVWGPLPFAFGPVPAERYSILHMAAPRTVATPGGDPRQRPAQP